MLWPRYKIPVIVYDEIGCGRSTILDDEKAGDESFWTISLFVLELQNLLRHFKLGDGADFNVLGLSFGTFITSEFAVARPAGLRRLVLGCPSGSTDLLIQCVALRIGELPARYQDALYEGIEKRQYTTEAFKEAYTAYFRHCLCRADPLPRGLQGFVEHVINMSLDTNTVTATMYVSSLLLSWQELIFCRWGLCPIINSKTVGSLRGWDVLSRLHLITAETLLWNGEYDQAHDVGVQPMFDRIPRVRWHTFPNASHVLTYESEALREGCFSLIGNFLTNKPNEVPAPA